MIVDLFAGPGGWSEALRRLGRDDDEVAVEWDRDACSTRARNGLRATIRADVSRVPLDPLEGRAEGLIASPPCQTFSKAGKGGGVDDLDRLVDHAHRGHLFDTPDPRTGLVLEPLRWLHTLKPRWLAFEQVPAVLPVWHAYEHHLRDLGYETWSGELNAANYGVPQTRRRAILLASLDRRPGRPAPTHEQHPHGFFALEPWVTMAEALDFDPAHVNGSWPWTMPATTVAGDPRISARCHHEQGMQGANPIDVEEVAHGVDPGDRPIKLRLHHAIRLQDFPADLEVAGPLASSFLQVGNAIPPGLAAAALREVLQPRGCSPASRGSVSARSSAWRSATSTCSTAR